MRSRPIWGVWLGIIFGASIVMAMTSSELAERIQAANMLVDKGCSGTLISLEHRLVLTAYHCIEGKITIEEREERKSDGTYRKIKRERKEDVQVGQVRYEQWRVVGMLTFDAELLHWDKALDLALLRFHSSSLPFRVAATLPPMDFEERPLSPVIVMGNPIGQENTFTAGIVSNTNRVLEVGYPPQKYRYIQLDAGMGPGSSGGAVYDAEHGWFFAMPAAGARGLPVNFAIPWRVIREFLEKHCWKILYDPSANREGCLAEKAKADKVQKEQEQP